MVGATTNLSDVSRFSAVKGSIVSRQIDRPVYYNALPRDASRTPQMQAERYLLEHPVNFSDPVAKSAQRGHVVEGYRGVLFFYSPPAPNPYHR